MQFRAGGKVQLREPHFQAPGHAQGVISRKRAVSQGDLAPGGDQVHGAAPVDEPRVQRDPWAIQVRLQAAFQLQLALQAINGGQGLADRLDGARPEIRLGAVRRLAGRHNLHGHMARVHAHHLEVCGLPDQGLPGERAVRGTQLIRQVGAPEAADLLVVGPHQDQGGGERRDVHLVQCFHGRGDEPLHVRSAPSIEPSTPLGEGKGVAAPRLAFHGHDIHVPGNHKSLVHAIQRAGRADDVRLARRCLELLHVEARIFCAVGQPGSNLRDRPVGDRGEAHQLCQGVYDE